jgi:hypothetical protein
MKRVMVRYRVKADRAAENRRHVEAVFAELARDRPEGIRYATFALEDGVSFVHLASIETADGGNPLLAVAAFRDFTAQIKDRCDEPPTTHTLDEVGSYRMFPS